MKNTKLFKLSIAILLVNFLHVAMADDTEIFLGTNTQPPDPKVLFIFDNSGSMDGSVPGSSHSRMSVAKKALLEIVHDPDNADLDIGLMLFNKNNIDNGANSNNGARVVFAIQDLTESNRGTKYDNYNDDGGSDNDGTCSWSGTPPAADTLTQLICNILSTTWTPLEESMYEAYLYYKGDNVLFGNQNRSPVVSPAKDPAAENSGSYISPVLEDASFINIDIDNPPNGITIDDLQCEQDYIVLMTDGEPSRDKAAHSKIHALDSDCQTNGSNGSCLDEMTKYLFENDLDNNSGNDKQHIVTYTIGFGSDAPPVLLTNAANKGGGEYFSANNASDLKNAFEEIFASINDSTASFASPSSTSSSTNDAQSLDYIYTNVFKPENIPKWSGNLKKYRLDTVQNGFYPPPNDTVPKYEFIAVDVNNNIVYDNNGDVISLAKGNSDENGNTYDVQSIWSLTPDTDIVALGGAGDNFASYASRNHVYTNTHITVSENLTHANNAFNASNTYLTYSLFNAVDDTEKNTLINWALGQDTKDENSNGSTSDSRWVMGDTLHSQPTIINYGKRNNLTEYAGDFSDIRIAMGTNAGFLHFFKDDLGGSSNSCSVEGITNNRCKSHTINDSVSESWSFIPTDLLSRIKVLNTNSASTPHPYGIDGEIAVYKYDHNQDGNIVSSEGDQVIIVFGMRRGGYYYYALDITNPDSPVYLWKFTHSEILQSWSKPEFGKIKYFDGSAVQTKTVAIFTAGYDNDKDTKGVLGTDDDDGRGLFIVDLFAGNILWSVLDGTTASDATTLYEPTLNDSIPATPRPVDINDDGILDRIYMADTGGSVWRIDLFNQDVETTAYSIGDDSRETWSIFKLANLGRGDVNNLSNDRRFFNQINFVQTRDSSGSFDALLLGSGHRNNPNEKAVQNRFYMLKDPNVVAYKFKNPGHACLDSTLADYDPYCKAFPTTLTNTSLTDVTTTALSAYSTNGWRLDLGVSGEGEKNLSSSVTASGKVYFTTYSPASTGANLCSVQAGSSYLYSVNIHTAAAGNDFNEDGTIDPEDDRKKSIKNIGLPGKPSLFSPDGKKLYINPGLGEKPLYAGDLKTQIYYWFKNSE